MRDDLTVLGQLLFRMLDPERAMLGIYLSRRTSKVVLKVFIGCGLTRRFMCNFSPFTSPLLLGTLIL